MKILLFSMSTECTLADKRTFLTSYSRHNARKDHFHQFMWPTVQFASVHEHVVLRAVSMKVTKKKYLSALRTFPGVNVFAHAQDARETATAPVQAQPVVDLSITGAMSGAAYSIRLYLPAS